ncbi:MAG TPA: hypothetical protein VK002_15650 [Rubricoccaceae bacterium]|nr:hypothetical protein [Rubricoccaceae bacterium]
MRAAWLALRSALLCALVGAALAVPRAGAQNLPLTALPFLEISPSPAVSAAGGAGVALAEPNPHGFLYNPAHLGLAARDARALSALYPGGFTDWLAHDELALGSIALAVGFDARVGGLPLAVGVGLGQTALRFGERVAVDERGAALGSYEPVDRYRALALGAATTGAVRVGVGATVRHVTSTDRVLVASDGVRTEDIWGLTFDLGLLAEADVARLLGRPRLPFGVPVQPALSVAVGYAQANLGGEVPYSGAAALPLPRTARLGWSALGGLDLTTAAGPLRLVEGAFAVQAEHSLVRAGDQPGEFRYEGFLGDLDPFRHGVLGEGNDVVTGRHGWRVAVAETVAYSRGGFDGWGFTDVRTQGLEVRLAGPLKAAALLTGSGRLGELASRFDLRLTHAVVFRGEAHESTFDGLTLVVRR